MERPKTSNGWARFGEGQLSHGRSHVLDIPKLMVLPQKVLHRSERPALQRSSLASVGTYTKAVLPQWNIFHIERSNLPVEMGQLSRWRSNLFDVMRILILAYYPHSDGFRVSLKRRGWLSSRIEGKEDCSWLSQMRSWKMKWRLWSMHALAQRVSNSVQSQA
jgi:hypothetical protein